jgi:hypothetical protein
VCRLPAWEAWRRRLDSGQSRMTLPGAAGIVAAAQAAAPEPEPAGLVTCTDCPNKDWEGYSHPTSSFLLLEAGRSKRCLLYTPPPPVMSWKVRISFSPRQLIIVTRVPAR